MSYDIPDSENIEWQQDMLRSLHNRLEMLQNGTTDSPDECLDGALEIVCALREYSGY